MERTTSRGVWRPAIWVVERLQPGVRRALLGVGLVLWLVAAFAAGASWPGAWEAFGAISVLVVR